MAADRKHGITLLQRLGALVLAVFLVAPVSATKSPVSAASPAAFYVESTGHLLGDPFLSFWIENDGFRTLGAPVTEVIFDGTTLTQVFEYGVVQGAGDAALERVEAGALLLALDHAPDALGSGARRPVGQSRVAGFSSVVIQLGVTLAPSSPVYAVGERVKTWYDNFGGELMFGKPLSNAFASGDRTVQWFQYGRIEIVAGEPRVAPVGLELAWRLGLDTSATQPDGALPFDPGRYREFAGDGTVRNADDPFVPTRIAIPKIKVDTVVESVPIANGVMGVPKNAWNVGWYPSTARPGEFTNVVMAGHRDWWGIGPVVFWNLPQLVPGDKIYVTGPDGSGATYVVRSAWLIDAHSDATELIADTGYEALTLITCGGTWNGAEYTSRYIVRAERV